MERQNRGFAAHDAGKKINGRKRHILTDTDGRLLTVTVHSAGIQDRDGGKMVLKASRARYPFVTRTFADGGCAGHLVR
jgi:Transposase DDE domain